MEYKEGIRCIRAKSAKAWRKWLEKNHAKEKSRFLIIYKKSSFVPSVYYPEAVDEALCFGWIDSVPKKRDEQSYYLLFTKRQAKSNWSAVNKAKVKKLMAEGKMAAAGMAMVELAKRSGTWNALNAVDRLTLPDDFRQALNQNRQAARYWEAFPPSAKRGILEWLFSAKRPETRSKRLKEVIRLAEQNKRANQYQPRSS